MKNDHFKTKDRSLFAACCGNRINENKSHPRNYDDQTLHNASREGQGRGKVGREKRWFKTGFRQFKRKLSGRYSGRDKLVKSQKIMTRFLLENSTSPICTSVANEHVMIYTAAIFSIRVSLIPVSFAFTIKQARKRSFQRARQVAFKHFSYHQASYQNQQTT